jgi:hypothetical protein
MIDTQICTPTVLPPPNAADAVRVEEHTVAAATRPPPHLDLAKLLRHPTSPPEIFMWCVWGGNSDLLL